METTEYNSQFDDNVRPFSLVHTFMITANEWNQLNTIFENFNISEI